MNVSMKLVGGADLAKRLGQLPAAVSKTVQRRALEKGAEPIRASAASGAPRDERANAPHLADNIVVGTRSLTRAGEGEVIVEVGPAKQPDDVFYGFFQEFGTATQQGTSYMRPAFDTQAGRSLNIIMAEMWASIRKKLAIGGGASTTGRGL